MTTELPHHRSQASRYVPTPSPGRGHHARQPKNGFGSIALIAGLLGIATAALPFLGADAWLVLIAGIALSLIGIVSAIIGLLRVGKGTADNKGVAITGLLLSVAGLAACAAWIVVAKLNAGSDGQLHLPATAGDRHTVEFVVTSTGGATVRYGTISSQNTASAPPSTDAWRAKASYTTGSHLVTVTADNTSPSLSNTITCSVLVDGQTVAENTGTTIALCTATVN